MLCVSFGQGEKHEKVVRLPNKGRQGELSRNGEETTVDRPMMN